MPTRKMDKKRRLGRKCQNFPSISLYQRHLATWVFGPKAHLCLYNLNKLTLSHSDKLLRLKTANVYLKQI